MIFEVILGVICLVAIGFGILWVLDPPPKKKP